MTQTGSDEDDDNFESVKFKHSHLSLSRPLMMLQILIYTNSVTRFNFITKKLDQKVATNILFRSEYSLATKSTSQPKSKFLELQMRQMILKAIEG